MTEAILVAIILAPAVLTFLLKSNASLAFLALCGGFTAQSFAVSDIKNPLKQAGLSTSSEMVSVFLIFLPALITLLLCRGPSSRNLGNPKAFLNLLTALALGGSLALMIAPLMGNVGGSNLTDVSFWDTLVKIQAALIGTGLFLSLTAIWLNHRKAPGHGKRHK